MFGAYVRSGCLEEARKYFSSVGGRQQKMFYRRDTERDVVQVLLADLKECSRSRNLHWGKQVHAEAVECGHIYVTNALINMYGKCGSMNDAHQVFDGLRRPTVVSWTALIMGYTDNGQGDTALNLFIRMRRLGPAPNSVTFVAALKAYTSLAVKGAIECQDRGKGIHNLATEDGCSSEIYVQNTLIDMYCKCGNMNDARQVFDSMHPDAVSWNALILGYAENGHGQTALDLFVRMKTEGPAPDYVTFVALLQACTSIAVKVEAIGWPECRNRGKEIHDFAVTNGCTSHIYVQNALIDMYTKCGSMMDAREVFDSMKRPDVVSWTTLILGYAENGQGHAALHLFNRMRLEGPAPDSVTFVAALKACGLVGALEFGRTLHSEIGNDIDVVLVTCLVDFYAKCGSLVDAQTVFDLHADKRNMITWNALLAGFSSCGDVKVVFKLFEGMQDAGFLPDGITFSCILMCCSHKGLVEKGKEFFDTMATKYGIVPNIHHYTCMIDLFGRANKLDDAVALMEQMPCSPNDVTWMTLLGACRKWKNLEIGRLAFQSLIKLDDTNAAGYLLMLQIYGTKQDQEMSMGLLKEETCWTNEVGEVHAFLVEDNRHPQIREILDKLEAMVVAMKEYGSVPGLRSVPGNIRDAKKEYAICGHSERLALACALINTMPGKTIRIVNNLGLCDDCHNATALISKLEHRTLICRDAGRIHIFKDGKCSCNRTIDMHFLSTDGLKRKELCH